MKEKAEIKPPVMTLALSFEAAAVRGALVSEAGRVLASQVVAPKQLTTRAVVASCLQLLTALAEHHARDGAEIVALGISVDGVVDPASQRVTIPAWSGWTRVPLAQQIERALTAANFDLNAQLNEQRAGQPHLVHPAIGVYARANSLAAAESWVGAARSKANVVYVELGDTLATGIVLQNRVLTGTAGLAGATGWLAVGSEFKHEYETQGALTAETVASALVRRAIESYDGDANSMLGSLVMNTPAQLTPELVVRAARGGETLATKVVNEHCRWLGRGLANLISLLNPDVIVLGGELAQALNPFLDEVRTEARRWAHPEAVSACRILPAKLSSETAALQGAARLALGVVDQSR